MWAPLPGPPEDFLQADTTFELRPDEARALVENIQRRQPETLLGSLCTKPDIAADCTYPWDVPESALPGPVTRVLRHARCFSELTTGPQIAYNILVARRARWELGWDTDEFEGGQLGILQRWVTLVESRNEELLSWADDLPAFWEVFGRKRVNHGTRAFITGIVTTAVRNPHGFENDPDIHEQISLREIQLKGRRARLGNRAALENWNRSPVGGQHTYRWSIAKGYLGEIAMALGADA